MTDQQALRASQAGTVEDDADMAGEPEPPRVGHPLPVKEKRVGFATELTQNGQEHRGFPEGEQTRYVGKPRGPPDNVLLNHFSRGNVPDDDPRNGFRFIGGEREIHPRDQPEPGNPTGTDNPGG